jgi:hypothetical protein
MTAFAAAVDVLFSDPNISAAATFIRSGDAARDIRVVVSRPDVVQDYSTARVQTDTVSLEIRVSDVAQPRRGDQIIVGGETRVVQGVPVRDRERLVWTVDTAPA